MLEILAMILMGAAFEALNQEDQEKVEATNKIYQYYEDYLEYYLDNARADIADRTYEYRKCYGYWPSTKNSHYSRKNIEKPDCVDGATDLHYLEEYMGYKRYYENVKRNLNINWISYEIKRGFDEIIEDEEVLDKFKEENELEC